MEGGRRAAQDPFMLGLGEGELEPHPGQNPGIAPHEEHFLGEATGHSLQNPPPGPGSTLGKALSYTWCSQLGDPAPGDTGDVQRHTQLGRTALLETGARRPGMLGPQNPPRVI